MHSWCFSRRIESGFTHSLPLTVELFGELPLQYVTARRRRLKGPASLVGLLRARVWHCVVRRGEKREYANSNMPPSPQSVPRSCSPTVIDHVPHIKPASHGAEAGAALFTAVPTYDCSKWQNCVIISSHCLLYVVDLFSVLVMTHDRCNITLILSEPLAVSVCRLFRVNTKHSNLSLVQISVNQISSRKFGWTELWSHRLRL